MLVLLPLMLLLLLPVMVHLVLLFGSNGEIVGIPQWRDVTGALGMQWPLLGSGTMVQNIGSCSGTPASGRLVIASMASLAFVQSSAAVAAQLSLGAHKGAPLQTQPLSGRLGA